ncbi:MAG: HAD-IA family hydrolase [Thermodesulfobacteriota bacterium]
MSLTTKRQIKACAFDLGNSLINDTRLSRDATVDMGDWLLRNSIIQSSETFTATYERINHGTRKPFISHTFGEIDFFEKTFQELAVKGLSAEAALKKYREILLEKIQPDPDIVNAFHLLRRKNIQIALLSNERACRVDAYMEKTGLSPFFDTIIVSERIGIEKPDLRFFQEALRRLNISAEELVMFGDNEIADGACKQLGIFFVLVTAYKNKGWVWEDGSPFPPDHIMKKITPAEMEAFLDTFLLK